MSFNDRQNHFHGQSLNGYVFSHVGFRPPEEHRQSFGFPANYQQIGHPQNVNNGVYNDVRPRAPNQQSYPVQQQQHGFRPNGNYSYNEGRPRAPDEMRRSGAFAPSVDHRVVPSATRPIVQNQDNFGSFNTPAPRPIYSFNNQREFLHDRNSPMQQRNRPMQPQHCFHPAQPAQKLPSGQHQQPTIPLQINENRSRNNSNEENITPPSSAGVVVPPVNSAISEPKFYRIKLEVPAALEELQRKQIENELLEKLNTTVSPVSSEEYDEPGCVSFIETTYEIPYTDSLSKENLVKSLSKFIADVPEGVTVKTCDPALLSQKLIAEHARLPLECLRFGNVNHEGTFLSHFEIAYNHPHVNNVHMKKKFMTTFQYGNKRICATELWNFESRHNLFARFFVTFDRDHISRIMVNVGKGDNFRLIFELTSPPFIKKMNKQSLADLKRDYHEKDPNCRFFKINRVNGDYGFPKGEELAESRFLMMEFDRSLTESTLHEVLSRLHFRTERPIEFVSMQINQCFLGYITPYLHWVQDQTRRPTPTIQKEPTLKGKKLILFEEEDPTVVAFGDKDKFYTALLNEKFPVKEGSPLENKRKRFMLTYHLEALTSRGAVVKDRLLLDQRIYEDFVKEIFSIATKDFDDCIRLLEAMSLFIDTRSRLNHMLYVLRDLYKCVKNQEVCVLQPPQELTNGYQRVLYVVCTPTRVIRKSAEIQMGNRVTRNYDSDGTEVIRVTFRDDDGNFMRENIVGHRNMERCVRDRMVDGIKIAGRTYTFFGSSGSQQRDQGAYFMIKEKVENTLKQLGNFSEIENIHKRLAREGQCLTQSRECNVPIRSWKIEPDVQRYDRNGKLCLFTDGAGRMSRAFAKKIAEFLGIPHYEPSAVQFRCGGKKGLLVVDPQLDADKKWAENNCPEDLENHDYDIVFRESQHKFEGEEIKYIEIVKCSMPQPTNLSRPLINIIDQNSAIQSRKTQETCGNRIEDLQENVVLGFADAAVDENKFRTVLDGLPYLINTEYLSQAKGFQLHQEPFFRRLGNTKTRYDLKKKLTNQTIPIPANLGRSMFGVPDSTQQLQYDQVFIQITKNVNDKFPAESTATEIITGPVLVTKNPALAEGDVRVFMAVDIPELHNLRDVMVFSVHGERWNCDEMAGSDADGDEYTGIWDKSLLLNRNQPAFDFTSDGKNESKLPAARTMEEKRANACFDLFINNVIGLLSDAHLVSSDLYGINALTTLELTRKVTKALDFGKCGQVPDKMTDKWTKDPKTGKSIPPEKSQRRPDFKGALFQPTYASAKLNGRLHRINKKAMDVISMEPLNEKITVNTVLAKKAWNDITDRLGVDVKNKILDNARKDFNGFVAQMRAIMDNYGIKTEAELLTGCFMEMKNKFADREEDGGSMYTTGSTIQQLGMDVWIHWRKMFFEQFGGWRQTTSSVDMYHEEDVCRRVCCIASEEMSAKALAYYKVCYESASSQHEFLSFAWLASDVLANIQQNYLTNHPDEIPVEESFFKKLADDVMNLVKGKKDAEFTAFSRRANHKPFILPFLGSYGKHYTGIRSTWFVLVEWAKMCGVLKNGLTEDHLLLIFIALGTQTISTGDQPFMEILPKTFVYDKANCESLDKGRTIVQLLRAMASRKFARLTSLNFEMLGAKMTLSKGEWISLHEAARKSFYSLLLNQRIDELLDSPATLKIKEWEPRVIELPDDADLHLLSSKLTMLTGAESILLRRMNRNCPGMVTAFIRGNQESEERFQQATQLKAQVYSGMDKEEIAELTRLNYQKILRQ